MLYCIFHDNQNTLFYVFGGSLEVSNSFIDHSGSFSQATSVSTSNNNSFINTITYRLQFFNSHHCSTDYPDRTPDQSPTPKNTPEETPLNTQNESPINTPEETPLYTQNESPINTPEETPLYTQNESPINTPEETPLYTLNESPINTHEETPLNNNVIAYSFRLVFGSLLIIVLLIIFVYAFGLICNSRLESSNISSSKSDRNTPSTI